MEKNKHRIESIIKFQRNYRFLKNELDTLSLEVVFLKDCVICMSNNLIYLHKIKLYEGVTNGYTVINNELSMIRNKLNVIPDIIKFSYLKKKDLDTLSKDICEIKSDILQYLNHIAVSDMKLLLRLLIGMNWQSNFKYNDLKTIDMLARLYNPISVWDSSYHSSPVPYIGTNLGNSNSAKRTQFNRDTIESVENNVKTSSIIIGDINAFPMFLKNLSDMVMKDKKVVKIDRKNDFNHMEMLGLFNNGETIVFTKNTNSSSLLEDKSGFNILVRINERVIVFQGFAKDDSMDLYKTNNYINDLYSEIKKYAFYDITTVPKVFKINYLDILNVRDILIYSPIEVGAIIRKRYNDYKVLRNKSLSQIINEFLLASKYRKLEILILFLCGSNSDWKLAYLLYDILKMKDKKDISTDIYNSLPALFKTRLDETEILTLEEEADMVKNTTSDLSYERQINMMSVSDSVKDKAIEKLKSLKNNFQGDNKAQSWLDGFLKIPFGTFCENKIMNFKKNFLTKINNPTGINSCEQIKNHLQVNYKNTDELNEWNEYTINKSKYLNRVHTSLDKVVYGHTEAKLQLERLFAQWINGETKGAVLGLCGPPGTGKTSLAKNGLSQCLIDDDGKPRPFAFLPIGGSVNGSTLVGHNFTYLGSTWGRIVDIVMTAGCLNPIIFIDEVDKVSSTEYGKEIAAVLTHLTDATQNDNFEDKYFSGIPIDLSKALIVFSFNDINLLDSILRDRITVIETKPYTLHEKIHIIQDYMLPEVLTDVGFDKTEMIFTPEIITYLIDTYTNEAGVRKIKEKIVEIVRDTNLRIIHDDTILLPFTVTREYIDDLFRNKPRMRITKVHKNPEIGLVNGLYATSSGTGGLTVIQVMKYPSEKMLDLTLTGQQGAVMKESVEYALRIAYNMLSDEDKEKILEDTRNKKSFGLHVHTPEAGTKKDGPSAGVAMTIAIYSVLSGKKINNMVAMTGEIDLCKNVRPIGGVYAKLSGAKASGITKVLIPKENLEDLVILRNDLISPEDDNFKVELIETLEDAISHCIV